IFAEDILKEYGSFMEQHDDKLRSLRKQICPDDFDPQSLTAIAPAIEINCGDSVESSLGHHHGRLTESELLSSKAHTTLANLCNQCSDLAATARQLQLSFLGIGARIARSERQLDTQAAGMALECSLHQMSAAIDFFCQLYFLLRRIILVLQNLWLQLSAFVALHPEASESQLTLLFDAMLELLEQLVVFNELLEQSNLSGKWPLYKKWLQTLAKSSDAQASGTNFELNCLQTSLDDIEPVISGNIFRLFLDSLQETKKQMNLRDASVTHVTQHCNACMRRLLGQLEAAHQAHEYRNYEDARHLLRLTAFVCTLHQLGIYLDGKLMRHVLEALSRYQRVPLARNVHWTPLAFIGKYARTLLKGQADKLAETGHRQYQAALEKLNQADLRSCRQLGAQLALWSIGMQRVLAAGTQGQLKNFARLLLQGQDYAQQLSALIDALVRRHLTLAMPMAKATLYALCKLLQYLHLLQATFAQNQILCTRFLSTLQQWQQQKLLQLLQLAKRNMLDLKLMRCKLSLLSALKLAEHSIRGGQSKRRALLLVNLALGEIMAKERALPADKLKLFKSIALRAHNLRRLQQHVSQQLDAPRLLDNYDMLTLSDAALKEYVQQQHNPYLLQNILAACNKLDKNLDIFQLGVGVTTTQRLFDWQREQLSTNLEYLLRVEALSHLLLSQEQPFAQHSVDLRHCINVGAIEHAGVYHILRNDLENYFTATFYNLTTIAPHDWKSYEKMRHLANRLLQLRPVDDYLPNQIIDQGIDVLQIMRNIHTFASSFAYNMNLQLFVELQSRGKHLDIIGTRHVANSVQTHGTGIINTTVNFIYQFLRQKFYTFSTFLHDEHIKSRLLKEYRYHAEHKHQKPYQSYPYERAEGLIKKIRKLGVSSNGDPYMDLFRKVITQVGNAVGYVRLLQSGSKNANYRSRSFMSRFNSKFVRSADLSLEQATEGSIREYEKSVEHLQECYSDCTNYFKLLMQGFQPFLCNPHNHHLRTFFLITPALIMNYIDYRVKEKLKMHKKDQARCSLFEDGFAMGLIYILNMLHQLGEFHELGWRLTVTQQLNAERLKLKDIVATSTSTSSPSREPAKSSPLKSDAPDEKLLQTVAITERHVNAYEQEYNLLYDTLSSAEIFFQ
ncbi:hypothetical protein KR222_003588, partial [Zaprionus bogoriensis]